MKNLFFVERRQGYSVLKIDVSNLVNLTDLKELVEEIEAAYEQALKEEKPYINIGGMKLKPNFGVYFKFKNYRDKGE